MVPRHKDGKRKHWEFTARELRALLLLIPLLALLVWLLAETARPRFDDTALILGDTIASPVNTAHPAETEIPDTHLFTFDPNSVTYEELRRMGIDKKSAASIIKYRTAGKTFAIAEDFAACYGITDSIYSILKPYIIIGEEYRLNPAKKSRTRPHHDSAADGNNTRESGSAEDDVPGASVPFDPNTLDEEGFVALGFTVRQARAIINFRNACGGFRTAEDFSKAYAVSDEAYLRLKDYIVIAAPDNTANGDASTPTSAAQSVETNARQKQAPAKHIELNGADSLSLLTVRGIGPKTASAILCYRRRLGGYRDVSQVIETGVVTERNWELMNEEIWADSCAIRKIDINFAPPNTIAEHPYITPRTMRRITRNRQLKGGWSTIEDMIEDNTLTSEEALKLAPYLHFGTVPLR